MCCWIIERMIQNLIWLPAAVNQNQPASILILKKVVSLCMKQHKSRRHVVDAKKANISKVAMKKIGKVIVLIY